MEKLKDIDVELAKYLLENIEKNDTWPRTYRDVADDLANRLGRPINAHFGLTRPLGRVMMLCFELDLPLITALVRRETNGKTQGVGNGFYKLACELKPEYKNIDTLSAWKQELALIRACTDWSALRNYLNTL